MVIKNFLFHRVSPKRDTLWDPMDVSLFDKTIEWISSRYQIVLLEDFCNGSTTTAGESTEKSLLATISFDDGFKDNIEYSAPILDKYRVKASFYVVTDCIDQNIPTWTYMLDHSIQTSKVKELSLDFEFLPIELRQAVLLTRDQRISFAKRLKPFLKMTTHENRNIILKEIAHKMSDVLLPKLMMNWADLIELSHAGHAIGSHTASHGALGTMDNEEEVRAELLSSGKKIEEKLGRFPETIAYPFGSYNQHIIDISKEIGYRNGLAVRHQAFKPLRDNRFEIPRIELYNESWFKTRLRLSDTFEKLKFLLNSTKDSTAL